MINNRLKFLEMMERGYHQDPRIQKKIRMLINRKLVHWYFETEIADVYVNESSIQQYYKNLGKKIRYRQIYLQNEQNRDTYEQLVRICHSTLKGAPFDSLAKEFSEHPSSAEKGGLMPVKHWTGPENRKVRTLFQLKPGRVSDIIEYKDGYVLLKVEEIETVEKKPLAEMREKIEQRLLTLYKPQMRQANADSMATCMDSTTFEWNENALEQIVEWGNVDPDFFMFNSSDTLRKAIESGRNRVVLEHNAGMVDYSDLSALFPGYEIPKAFGISGH
ncbi:MAG: peptidylprolyl isomerase [candidate division KSB1 bacterium]|nr:peptidylprolyl isomerase [candidate division KSB1 bacterium]